MTMFESKAYPPPALASKEQLLTQAPALAVGEDFELPSGFVVKIRPLTRGEALKVKGKEMPVDQMEQKLLSFAMVDPKMSERDVKTWQEVCMAGELEGVTQRIAEISGLTKAEAKEAVATFRDES